MRSGRKKQRRNRRPSLQTAPNTRNTGWPVLVCTSDSALSSFLYESFSFQLKKKEGYLIFTIRASLFLSTVRAVIIPWEIH